MEIDLSDSSTTVKADIPPLPDLVNWANVGVNNTAKHLAEMVSLGLTSALCIFWTIPVRTSNKRPKPSPSICSSFHFLFVKHLPS